ncbi:uncharacterized protein [Henckelia pumila]|uniref:uncharacterized protein n=1 Tax=Henckelia pumila TaxID=405737 RepID=UPI003C6EA26D
MEYNGRLKSLANEASILGDPILNERLVSKVLRSLPRRFHTKVCAIDESKDTSIMGLDELISSLRTYEMELEAEDDSKVQQEVKDSDLEENSIALISKKFTDYLKVMKENKDVKSAQSSNFPRLPTSEKPQNPAATRGPRQRECKGYGHYAYECANRLRKGMNVSLSDDDSEEEQEKFEQADLISFTALLESKKNFQINPLGVGSGVATPRRNTIQKSVCFVTSNLDNFSNHEEQVDDPYTLEGIRKLYEELYCDWNKRNQLNTTLTKENTELKAAMARLEILLSKKDLELGLLNSDLERAKTTLDKFNSMFVKEGNDFLNHPLTALKGKKPIVEKNISVPKSKQWKRPFVCHYCLKPGHIRPFCQKLKNDYVLWESKQVLSPVLHNTKSNTGKKRSTVKKVWVQKPDIRCFVIYTSLKANTAGLKDHLTDYIEQNGGKVTYRGGAKGRIVGKGTLNVEGFPKLHNVLHVEGLNANLISISTRSVDNCYQLGEELACRHSKIDEFSLWHQKLGHVNFKTLKNLSKFEAVRGLPNLKTGVPYVCGACQKGKQTRVAHPVLQHCGTTRCLELLHMNLMGPMDVESYGARIRTDHEKEFENSSFSSLCDKKGISQEFSSPKTPQQNGIAKRKNKTMYNLRTRTMMESINVVFDDGADLKGKTAEDDVEGLLEIPPEEHSVVPDVTTPNTTLVPSEIHEENSQNNEEAEIITEKNLSSKIQKNHPSSQIIGDVHGTRQTRGKDKVDYRKMVGLVCMSSVYSQANLANEMRMKNSHVELLQFPQKQSSQRKFAACIL